MVLGNDERLTSLPIVRRLLASPDPTIEYKARVHVLGEPTDGEYMCRLGERIRNSDTASRLLSHLQADGTIATNPYKKWQGPLWTLVSLALIEYPPGDRFLIPIRDQAYDWLLSPNHLRFFRTLVIQGQEDRVRRCASQEGFVIWSTLKLGIADGRTRTLVERLKRWQWPDGGWNCDKRPQARISSFYETLQPMRALAYYGRLHGDREALDAAEMAAQVLLKRSLFRGLRDGRIIDPQFTALTFPYFYHYNILFALLVMAQCGFIHDPRCAEALDLLEAKRLPDGGFPLERRIFKKSDRIITRGTFADWGPVGKRKVNESVTVDALTVLRSAGRL